MPHWPQSEEANYIRPCQVLSATVHAYICILAASGQCGHAYLLHENNADMQTFGIIREVIIQNQYRTERYEACSIDLSFQSFQNQSKYYQIFKLNQILIKFN